jgi:membrane fusion protein, multidrug efflux system
MVRMSLVAVLAASIAGVTGCNKASSTAQTDAKGQMPASPTAQAAAASGATAGATMLISPEDLLTLRNSALSSGPAITGSVQPERLADLRAEVSAIVLAVVKENGDPVRRGDLLVRLDDTSIRDTLTAAEASERAAILADEQSKRQLQRMQTLRQTGLVSAQQLEDAESKADTAQSDREAARTRVVTARQQLQRTEVRAPFDGIVSDRKVSAGDTAQVGKELVKVIDPHSLRFEGRVSAESIGEVRAGQTVMFRVHGFNDHEYLGTIARVNPAANATTRQVEVLVTFNDPNDRPTVAGLYGEGRVETRRTAALMIPPSALVKEGDNSYVWRVKDRKLQKVSLTLGDRDPRSGEFVLKSGLAEGDTLLRYPNSTLRNDQPVDMAPTTAFATAAK